MKTAFTSPLLLAGSLVVLSLHGASPPNDAFEAATVLTGTSLSLATTNTGATKEPGEPDHAGDPGGSSLWWTWTSPADGDLTVNTDGSEIDTLLAVYSGNNLMTLSLLSASDDHGLVFTSRVRFTVLQGTVFHLAVDGFGGESGPIMLNLSFVSGPLARPPNDTFTNRLLLTSLPVGLSGDNTNATHEAGEPDHAGWAGDTSVWWSWTAPSSETVRVRTEDNTFDTLLAVYRGAVITNLSLVASNDDAQVIPPTTSSALFFDARAGERYEIAVDGWDGSMGSFRLSIEPLRPRFGPPVRLPDGSTELVLLTLSGSTNELQATLDFQTWSSLGTGTATNGTVRFTDGASGAGPRFYRARRLAPP